MTDTAKLKAAAERQKFILAHLASFEPTDIDGDTVDLRFEDENGCDTGCDVSIIAECQRSADLVDELIAALEAADRRNAELNSTLERWATDRAQSASELDDAEKRIAHLESAHKFRKAWKQLAIKSISEREKDITELTRARQRVTELEARTLRVNMPALRNAEMMSDLAWNSAIDHCIDALIKATDEAGINLETGGEA
ncbi:hypothetical protein ACSMAD_001871 [Cronobacter sakazakii]